MNWLKENWDRASLLVVSGLVIACSVMVLLNNSTFEERFEYSPVVGDARERVLGSVLDEKNQMSKDEQERELQALFEDIDGAKSAYKNTVDWRYPEPPDLNKKVPIFKSVILLQKGQDVIDMLAPDGAPLRPPLTNQFLLKYGLDYERTDVRERDEDGDGFSNLEEFRGVNGKETDPTDAKSHPPLTTKLYLKNRIEIPYSLELVSKSADIYTLRAVEDGEATRKLVRLGEVFVDRFTIVPGSFETRTIMDERLNIERQVDFVKVLDAKSGKELELREKLPFQLPTYQGELLFGLKVDGDLTVDQQGHFGIDGAGRIHPAGTEGIEGIIWYRLIQIEENEALISPCDKDGNVAEGAPRIRIEHLSKRPVPSTPGTTPTTPGLPTDPPAFDPATGLPLPTDPATPVTPTPVPTDPTAPGTPTPAEVPAPTPAVP